MLNSNTIRFGTDIFGALPDDVEEIQEVKDGGDPPPEETDSTGEVVAPFVKTALLQSKSAAVWDCTNKAAVTGFNVTAVEPANTKVRFVFKVNNGYYRISSIGALEEITASITANNVLKYGNTPAELNAVQAVDEFIGHKIFPVIALRMTSEAESAPSVKIALKAVSLSNVLKNTVESMEFPLTEDGNLPSIISITPDTTCTGNAEITLQVRLQDDEGNWSAYMALADAADKQAAAVQFKITYTVTKTDGSESARLNWINIEHTYGQMLVADENADLYTIVQSYDIPLQMCHVTVRHSPLNDSQILAYVNFMHPPSRRELINIGKANGAIQEFVLGVDGVKDTNIDASTLQIFAGTVGALQAVADFSYNSETSTVTLKAKSSTQIFASYDYDHDSEVWRRMKLEVTEPYNNETADCMSRFVYSLPDSEAEDKVVSNVRLIIKRTTGKVSNYDLGVAPNPKQNPISLPHIPKPNTIKFSDDNVAFTYDDETDVLYVQAPTNTPRIITYSWRGESVTIYSIACGWSVA